MAGYVVTKVVKHFFAGIFPVITAPKSHLNFIQKFYIRKFVNTFLYKKEFFCFVLTIVVF